MNFHRVTLQHNNKFIIIIFFYLIVSVITIYNLIKLLYGKPVKRDWVEKVVFPIQILLIFDGRWIRYL